MAPNRPAEIFSDWYRQHASRYAEVAVSLAQSTFVMASHPRLTGEMALFERLKELAAGNRGLDVGCGPGARDVYLLTQAGYDMTGLDAVPEAIDLSLALHPELAGRLLVADLTQPLPFPNASFDFVVCDSVIQHIEPDPLLETTLPEIARMLRPGGLLQLLFKRGQGVTTVHDPDYDTLRTFRLYDEQVLLAVLEELGLALVEAPASGELGGVLHCEDHRRIPLCVMWLRKTNA